MAEDERPRKFKFKIQSYHDVEEHLDALWDLHNQLAEKTQFACNCLDPPGTCGLQPHKEEDE